MLEFLAHYFKSLSAIELHDVEQVEDNSANTKFRTMLVGEDLMISLLWLSHKE